MVNTDELSKFYKVFFNDVAAAGVEYALIDLDNDLDLDRDEAIVIHSQHMAMTDDVAWTDPESFGECQIVEDNVNPLYIFQYPKLIVSGVGAAAAVEGSGSKTDHINHKPVLMPKNFYVAARNNDTTTAHDFEWVMNYSVVSLKKLKLLDIYGILRGQEYETT